MPTNEGGEEFFIRGRGEIVDDAALKAQIVAATDFRQGGLEFEILVRCCLETVLYTKWDNWGTAETMPNYVKWHV